MTVKDLYLLLAGIPENAKIEINYCNIRTYEIVNIIRAVGEEDTEEGVKKIPLCIINTERVS